MIQKIFITLNSVPIVSKDFITKRSGQELNEELISSYINAISTFAKKVHNDDMETIILGKSKIFYRILPNLVVTILFIADREDETLEINSKINILINNFLNSYNAEDLASWNGDNSFFDPFYLILDDIVLGEVGKIKENFKEMFDFTTEQLRNNFDGIVNSIILGDKIIMVGKKDQLETIIPILEIFSYNKVLKTIYWSDEEQDADIIGVNYANFKYFDLRKGKVIVDLIKNKIFGGSSDVFCKNLIKDLSGLNYEKALSLINTRMQVIYSKVNSILVLSHKGLLDKKILELTLKDVDKSARNLIMKLIGKQDIHLYQFIENYGLKD